MQASKRLILAIIMCFVISGSFAFGFITASVSNGDGSAPSEISGGELPTDIEADFSPFWKAWNTLDEKFAGTTTPASEKIWAAIEGVALSFDDPYTVFFPPEESLAFEEEINGNFQGVGMEVGLRDSKITVVAPLKDSPAEKAGMQPGDIILKIDGKSTADLAIDQAVKLIRGKAGTKVVISVERDGKPVEVSIVRAVIDMPTIRTEVKPGFDDLTEEEKAEGKTRSYSKSGLRKDGVFVIELYSFTSSSANLFRNALKEFIDSGSTKLVLDLRGNPGGYLDAAVDMASFFLPKGKIILKEKFGREEEARDYRSKGYDIFDKNLKMVILLNGGSASASEILAGALSEHGIAKTVGTKTFGKGSVQELVKITDDTSLKVTVAKWYTPLGISISEKGIMPEYIVDIDKEDIEAERDPQLDKAIELLSQ